MHITIVGNFGLRQKGTMAARALPIARELARRGHSITVVMPADVPAGERATPGRKYRAENQVDSRAESSLRADTSAPKEAIEDQESRNVDLVRLISVGSSSTTNLVAQVWLGLQISWCAWRSRPSVLYAFKPIRYAGLTLLLFWTLRRFGLSSTVLALDTDDWEGEDGWADHDHYPWLQRRLVIWQEQWCLRRADVVTVASRELEKLSLAVRSEVAYAPNAASPASPGWVVGAGHLARQSHGLGEQPVVLAYTRFVEFCPARLLDTFQRIRARIPSAQLLVVGQGLKGEEKAFLTDARERGLDCAVHFAGWVAPSEIPSYFGAADVALYPLDDTRLNRAKCLMKLVDLLLAGVPVVADAVGQAIEYVEDGHTGMLVKPGDVVAMAEQASALLEDRERGRALGQAARESMLEKWRWQDLAAIIDRALTDRTCLGARYPPLGRVIRIRAASVDPQAIFRTRIQ